MNTEQRAAVLENAFENYDFEDRVVLGVNGWEHCAPNGYRRVFFLEKHDASQRAVFNVEFKPDSIEVQNLGWE